MRVSSEQPFPSTAEPGSLRAAGRLPGTSRGSPTIGRGAAGPGGDGGPTVRTAAPSASSCPARPPAGACRPRGQTEAHRQPPDPLGTWKACGPARRPRSRTAAAGKHVPGVAGVRPRLTAAPASCPQGIGPRARKEADVAQGEPGPSLQPSQVYVILLFQTWKPRLREAVAHGGCKVTGGAGSEPLLITPPAPPSGSRAGRRPRDDSMIWYLKSLPARRSPSPSLIPTASGGEPRKCRNLSWCRTHPTTQARGWVGASIVRASCGAPPGAEGGSSETSRGCAGWETGRFLFRQVWGSFRSGTARWAGGFSSQAARS